MRNHGKIIGQQIGFFAARPPQMSSYQPAPYMTPRPPFIPPGAPSMPPMTGGGAMPGASSPGLGGLLQGLLSGSGGQLDIASLLSNAQKVIGVVNQMGPIVQNLSPMLQMIKGFSSDSSLSDDTDDTLSEINQETSSSKPPRRRRRRKGRARRKLNHSKARKRRNR